MIRQSQKSRILKYLLSGKKITPMIAYEKFGCLRLSERIRECIYDLAMSDNNDHNLTIQKGWKQVNRYTRVRVYWL